MLPGSAGRRHGSVVAESALAAARKVRAAFADCNQQGDKNGNPSLEFGLALHVGAVFYGNIGTDDRLDFTIVGPAVNLASRVQDMCRRLARDILISSSFLKALGDQAGRLDALGTHNLRGVAEYQRLFAVPD